VDDKRAQREELQETDSRQSIDLLTLGQRVIQTAVLVGVLSMVAERGKVTMWLSLMK
jgi:hypothetical protein